MAELVILSKNNAPAMFDRQQHVEGHTFRVLRCGDSKRKRPVAKRQAAPCEWRTLLDKLPAGEYVIQLIGPNKLTLNSVRVRRR